MTTTIVYYLVPFFFIKEKKNNSGLKVLLFVFFCYKCIGYLLVNQGSTNELLIKLSVAALQYINLNSEIFHIAPPSCDIWHLPEVGSSRLSSDYDITLCEQICPKSGSPWEVYFECPLLLWENIYTYAH